MTPKRIFQKHRDQILVTDAHGIAVQMRGIDREANPEQSNTVRAEKVVQFWRIVLHALHARHYTVVTALP